jgi:hypothetical protein
MVEAAEVVIVDKQVKVILLLAVSEILSLKLLKVAVCILVTPVAAPITSKLPPRDIVVSPVSFNMIAFAALMSKSFP